MLNSKVKIARPEWEKNKPANSVNEKPDIVKVYETLFPEGSRHIKYSGRAISCLCPLHGDRNRSFALYTETNTFYCFTCSETGDSYTLAMKILDCDFKTAADYCRDNDLFT
jgi:DNA primase